MEKNLDVMEKAVEDSLQGVESVTGLTGGDAVKVQEYMKENTPLSGQIVMDAVSKAMGTNEVNAAMGTICATPTAGSAGCVPGTLFAVKNQLNPTREQMIRYYLRQGPLVLSLPIIHSSRALPEGARQKLARRGQWRLRLLSKWQVELRSSRLKHLL